MEREHDELDQDIDDARPLRRRTRACGRCRDGGSRCRATAGAHDPDHAACDCARAGKAGRAQTHRDIARLRELGHARQQVHAARRSRAARTKILVSPGRRVPRAPNLMCCSPRARARRGPTRPCIGSSTTSPRPPITCRRACRPTPTSRTRRARSTALRIWSPAMRTPGGRPAIAAPIRRRERAIPITSRCLRSIPSSRSSPTRQSAQPSSMP